MSLSLPETWSAVIADGRQQAAFETVNGLLDKRKVLVAFAHAKGQQRNSLILVGDRIIHPCPQQRGAVVAYLRI